MRGLSEAELPSALTREHAEELQARSLLNDSVIPEGNRTVSWVWRGSLKDDLRGQGGQDKYSEG